MGMGLGGGADCAKSSDGVNRSAIQIRTSGIRINCRRFMFMNPPALDLLDPPDMLCVAKESLYHRLVTGKIRMFGGETDRVTNFEKEAT